MGDTANRLSAAAQAYVPRGSADAAILALDKHWIESNVIGPRVLEMGCSDGTSTRFLLKHAEMLDVVEGAERYCEMLRREIQDDRLRVFQSLYETFEPNEVYDDVVLARSLDYVDNPVGVLKRVRSWLSKQGRLHVVVQNARSIHRRIGLALGLLDEIDGLNEFSRSVGHQRVYTIERLIADLEAGGFKPDAIHGFLLKPFDFESMNRLDHNLARDLIPALYEVGKELPLEFCSQIYVKCVPLSS